MFSGKKTYLMGIGALMLAVGGALHGDYTVPQAAQLGVEALLAMFLRAGIGKISL